MTFEKIPYKIYLTEDEMPMNWYNVRADMKTKPAPLLNPATGTPMGFDDLRPVFCDELIRQELDNDTREIPIPQEIRDFYKMYRPSPLVRAYCLEEKLQTPAKIYYKFEGNNTSGSHGHHPHGEEDFHREPVQAGQGPEPDCLHVRAL